MILRMMEKEVNGVFVLTLDGRIVLGEESHFFREKLMSLAAEGKNLTMTLTSTSRVVTCSVGTACAFSVGGCEDC